MRIFRRILILGALTLAAGLAVNRINPRGSPWRLLVLAWTARVDSAGQTAAEDAYILWMDQKAVFIDVRDTQAFEIDHISEAPHMPFLALARHPGSLDGWA